jgi:hypothetical protein
MSNQVIVPPRRRACECCGREDIWNDEAEGWLIASESPGSPQCIHEWDINGRYNPFGE